MPLRQLLQAQRLLQQELLVLQEQQPVPELSLLGQQRMQEQQPSGPEQKQQRSEKH
ncbi:hypothetical protein AA106556_0248 [Neokomagataea tanensis NBRC 106556]|uniref:Uncharacterized protein n=1 Tax=Neokomagataea tanensis NBRC 106556 TaxID=1223519 RepID=A0ABQ0QGG0_9PROT|nr:hypothetical protein AA106556_0248 [Neokomagataea tanensis NBRC 106556]